jgi:hypothetical protein
MLTVQTALHSESFLQVLGHHDPWLHLGDHTASS